jgi:alkaline phosphatase
MPKGIPVSEGRSDWTLIETREQFEALATQDDPPARVLGLARIGDKIQTTGALPDEQRTTPDLATMVRGAINVLSRNEQGFFLMVEGGAPDWAAHDNALQRLVHELADFDAAVAAVCEWVEAHGGWERNLVIVTTDHGNGLLLGPNSDTVAFEPIINGGKGELPGARWHTGSHTNELVRLWAHGAGSELFARHTAGRDEHLAQRHPGWGPEYVDNTAVFHVMRAALLGAAEADAADPAGDEGQLVPQPMGEPLAE